MKKLMIAAAVAAMIGATEAVTPAGAAYDFSVTLKTTKSKEGKGSTIKYEVKLGRNSEGEYWYNSENITRVNNTGVWTDTDSGENYVIATFDKNNIGKLDLSELSVNQRLTFAYEMEEYGAIFENGVQIAGSGEPDKYKGKDKWCATVSFKDTVAGQCYRVAGTEKVTATYVANSCCWGDGSSDDIWRLETVNLKKNDQLLPDLTANLLYRFGAETSGKAKKVEFVGQIGNGVGPNGCFSDEVLPSFALAAQGDYCELKDANGTKIWGVKCLSGNMVGTWYDPMCEVCCGYNGIATCWALCCDDATCQHDGDTDCDYAYEYQYDADNELYYERFGTKNELDYLWGTAAYGSFTLKFNSKNSVF